MWNSGVYLSFSFSLRVFLQDMLKMSCDNMGSDALQTSWNKQTPESSTFWLVAWKYCVMFCWANENFPLWWKIKFYFILFYLGFSLKEIKHFPTACICFLESFYVIMWHLFFIISAHCLNTVLLNLAHL